MKSSYSPVPYVHREVIAEEIAKQTQGKVFYFSDGNTVESAEGRITTLEELNNDGLFIVMDPEEHIRIDRIITLFGKPAAAYDEYDAYGSACMDCTGGYDPD